MILSHLGAHSGARRVLWLWVICFVTCVAVFAVVRHTHPARALDAPVTTVPNIPTEAHGQAGIRSSALAAPVSTGDTVTDIAPNFVQPMVRGLPRSATDAHEKMQAGSVTGAPTEVALTEVAPTEVAPTDTRTATTTALRTLARLSGMIHEAGESMPDGFTKETLVPWARMSIADAARTVTPAVPAVPLYGTTPSATTTATTTEATVTAAASALLRIAIFAEQPCLAAPHVGWNTSIVVAPPDWIMLNPALLAHSPSHIGDGVKSATYVEVYDVCPKGFMGGVPRTRAETIDVVYEDTLRVPQQRSVTGTRAIMLQHCIELVSGSKDALCRYAAQ